MTVVNHQGLMHILCFRHMTCHSRSGVAAVAIWLENSSSQHSWLANTVAQILEKRIHRFF